MTSQCFNFRYRLGEVKLNPISNETFDNFTVAALNQMIDRTLLIDPSLRPSAAALLVDIGKLLQSIDEPTQSNVKIDQEFGENIQCSSIPNLSAPSDSIPLSTSFIRLSE
jgi:hypothetical protein